MPTVMNSECTAFERVITYVEFPAPTQLNTADIETERASAVDCSDHFEARGLLGNWTPNEFARRTQTVRKIAKSCFTILPPRRWIPPIILPEFAKERPRVPPRARDRLARYRAA